MTENTAEPTRRRVVVGIDSSENATRAARWAAAEAVSRGVPLLLAHALHASSGEGVPLEPVDYAERCREEGRTLLESTAEKLRHEFPKLSTETELSDYSAARMLASLSLEAALVVTGTRGRGGFTGMLVGSVSRKLAAHAHSPLVVIRGEQPAETIDEVVLGIQSRQPEAAIRYAFDAAQRYGVALHAVRGWLPGAMYSGPMGDYFSDFTEIRNEERRAVEHLLAPYRASFPAVKTEITAARGNPVPILIEAARGTRLLVVGAHRHRGPLAVGAGYTVDGLLAHSPTPVAIVPSH
jgi:nucleotide-binding universal stress UspA family protein